MWPDSDHRRYFVACPHCQERQYLKWSGSKVEHGVKWSCDEAGSLNGTAVVLRPLYGTLYKSSLSASGLAVRWTPNFSAPPKDTWFVVESTKHMAGAVYAGEA